MNCSYGNQRLFAVSNLIIWVIVSSLKDLESLMIVMIVLRKEMRAKIVDARIDFSTYFASKSSGTSSHF